MRTTLQKELAQIAPNICIKTVWCHDISMHPDIRKDCDGFDDENPDDWQCWQSEVIASTIQCGLEVQGNACMGGTWHRVEDSPWIINPDISGYERDMTLEALTELSDITSIMDRGTRAQIDKAIDHVRRETVYALMDEFPATFGI